MSQNERKAMIKFYLDAYRETGSGAYRTMKRPQHKTAGHRKKTVRFIIKKTKKNRTLKDGRSFAKNKTSKLTTTRRKFLSIGSSRIGWPTNWKTTGIKF
jgi:hypothetical protein